MKRSKAFTVVELLVVIPLVVIVMILLFDMLAPSMPRARELAKRAMCGSNLKSINTGVALYGSENAGAFPILPDMDEYAKGNCRGKPNAAPHANNGQGARGAYDYNELLCLSASCTAGGDLAINNDYGLGAGAQQNLCLLIKDGSVVWGLFNCPSVGKVIRERTSLQEAYGLGEGGGGVAKTSYIHYGVQIPYKTTPLVGIAPDNKNRCPMSVNMDPKVAWLADRGPSAVAAPGQTAPDTCTRYSPNHGNEGETILFGDGHVEFCKDTNNIQISSNNAYPDNFTYKNASGYARNNIYTHDYWRASITATSTRANATSTGVEPVLIKHGTRTETPVSTAADDWPTKDSVIYDWMMFP